MAQTFELAGWPAEKQYSLDLPSASTLLALINHVCCTMSPDVPSPWPRTQEAATAVTGIGGALGSDPTSRFGPQVLHNLTDQLMHRCGTC